MPTISDYDKLDGLDLAALVRRREVSASELLEEAITRVERVNPRLNAVVTRLYDDARQQAKGPLEDGRFKGVPFLLKDLDAYYPEGITIRVILDNHSAHISKETRAYLATRPNRFSYVHTPKHGSWLNLVETLFGKMAHTFLRQIRVKSKAELKERILRGIAEINAAPVVHRWKKFDLLAS